MTTRRAVLRPSAFDGVAPLDACPVTFVVPAFQAESTLAASIETLRASAPEGAEIIVVDDGSWDETVPIAMSLADRVVRRPCQGGAARARNDGVQVARAEIIVFVDADVTVNPEAVRGLIAHLESDADAVFGAYEVMPPPAARNRVTIYKNLLHHYTHLQNAGPATTFWSGFGGVRRDVLVAVSGFDTAVTNGATVEDIHLGYRLSQAGYRVLLDPTLQVQHHKKYTLRGLLKSDIASRAIPWTRIMLQLREFSPTLNLDRRARASTVVALLMPASLAASFVVGRPAVIVLGGLTGLWTYLNREFLRFAWREWSPAGAGWSASLLLLFYWYAPLGAVGGAFVHRIRLGRSARLNWLAVDPGSTVANGGCEVSVVVATHHPDRCDAIGGLPEPAPWWELLVVAPEPPPDLPVGTTFVPSGPAVSMHQFADTALPECQGQVVAVLGGQTVPDAGWLDRVRVGARRGDVAFSGSFQHDKRGLRERARQVSEYWAWRPESPPSWHTDHPFDNIAFRADLVRSLGGFSESLVLRLQRLGARPIRFDPEMQVHLTECPRFWKYLHDVGGRGRFRAGATTRFFEIGGPHRALLVLAAPFNTSLILFRIVRSAISEGTGDGTFWLALPLTVLGVSSRFLGRALGYSQTRAFGGNTLRDLDDLADLEALMDLTTDRAPVFADPILPT